MSSRAGRPATRSDRAGAFGTRPIPSATRSKCKEFAARISTRRKFATSTTRDVPGARTKDVFHLEMQRRRSVASSPAVRAAPMPEGAYGTRKTLSASSRDHLTSVLVNLTSRPAKEAMIASGTLSTKFATPNLPPAPTRTTGPAFTPRTVLGPALKRMEFARRLHLNPSIAPKRRRMMPALRGAARGTHQEPKADAGDGAERRQAARARILNKLL